VLDPRSSGVGEEVLVICGWVWFLSLGWAWIWRDGAHEAGCVVAAE
jgi:hypothetical protein